MKTLFLIRGLPGSGKTTVAEKIPGQHVEADDFFYDDDGVYTFDWTRLGEAHAYCQGFVRDAMQVGEVESIVVSNTFVKNEHIAPYLKLAAEFGYMVHVLTVESGLTDYELSQANVHGCPLGTIEKMRDGWEDYVDEVPS